MTRIVFGMLGTLNADACVTVFVGVLVLLILLEYLFEKLEKYAKDEKMSELFEKVRKELMMMGMLSFLIFLYETIAVSKGQAITNPYYESFEVCVPLIFPIAAFGWLLHTQKRIHTHMLSNSTDDAHRHPLHRRGFHRSSSLSATIRRFARKRVLERHATRRK